MKIVTALIPLLAGLALGLGVPAPAHADGTASPDCPAGSTEVFGDPYAICFHGDAPAYAPSTLPSGLTLVPGQQFLPGSTPTPWCYEPYTGQSGVTVILFTQDGCVYVAPTVNHHQRRVPPPPAAAAPVTPAVPVTPDGEPNLLAREVALGRIC